MAARDRNPGFGADRFAARENQTHRLHRQLVERHADQGEGEQRRGAHRIDIGERVGRGDRAEVERIVDDRHEEIGRGDDRLRGVDLVDGGVIRGFYAHQKLRWQEPGRRAGEELPQHGRRDLAAAAATMAELGEPKRGAVGGVHCFTASRVSWDSPF